MFCNVKECLKELDNNSLNNVTDFNFTIFAILVLCLIS